VYNIYRERGHHRIETQMLSALTRKHARRERWHKGGTESLGMQNEIYVYNIYM
jgi:hypothetical protein